MLVWSIRTPVEVEQLLNTGVLRTDTKKMDQDFLRDYNWMSQQLTQRVEVAPPDVTYPIWVWVHYYHTQKSRPDLRRLKRTWSSVKGKPFVLLTLDIPNELILMSSFDAWHAVLNNHPYTSKDEEYEYFEQVLPTLPPEEAEQLKQQTWQRIFEFTSDECVQGVVWELRREWLIKVQYFTSQPNK